MMWKQIKNAPVWLLRSVVLAMGFLDGVGVAILIAVLLFDYGLTVDVTVKNESSHEVTVRFDSVQVEILASSRETTLIDDVSGAHRLELFPDSPDAIGIDLRFNADSSWGTEFIVELHTLDGKPTRR